MAVTQQNYVKVKVCWQGQIVGYKVPLGGFDKGTIDSAVIQASNQLFNILERFFPNAR